MADEFAVVNFTVPSSGTFDITSSAITDWKAAFIILSGSTTDATVESIGRFCYGAVAKTGASTADQRALCARAMNGQTAAVSGGQRCTMGASDSHTLQMIANASSTYTLLVSWSANLSNGVRLSVDTGTETGQKGVAFLYGGDGSAFVDQTALVGGYASAPFRPDFYIMGTGEFTDAPTAPLINVVRVGMGFGVDLVGEPQMAIGGGWAGIFEGTTTDCDQTVRNNRVQTHIDSPSTEETTQITSFNATGFSATVSTGAPDAIFLGLSLSDSELQFGVAVEDLPSATGSTSFTGLGFKPQVCFALTSLVTTENTPTDGSTAGCYGFGIFTSSDEGAVAASNQDGITMSGGTPSVSDSYVNSGAAIAHLDHDGTLAVLASLDSFGASGPTLNFTTATAGKMVLFAIGAAVPEIELDETVQIVENVLVIPGKLVQVDETVQIIEADPLVLEALAVFSQFEGKVDGPGAERGVVSQPGIEEGRIVS